MLVSPQTDHQQPDSPLPQHTGTSILCTAAPLPPSSPFPLLLRWCFHSHTLPAAVQFCVQKISFIQLVWERHHELDYSAGCLHFDVKTCCVTNAVGKYQTPSPLRSRRNVFENVIVIPAALPFTFRIWTHLWMDSCVWMISPIPPYCNSDILHLNFKLLHSQITNMAILNSFWFCEVLQKPGFFLSYRNILKGRPK